MSGPLKPVPNDPAASGARPPAVPAPAWVEEIQHSLAIRSQFVVSGNLNDLSPVNTASGPRFVPFLEALWRTLRSRGVALMLVHDPVAGLRLFPGGDAAVTEALSSRGVPLTADPADLESLRLAQKLLAEWREMPAALVIDHASHLRGDLDPLFLSVARTDRAPLPPRPKSLAAAPRRNPTFWLVDRAADLPDWFLRRNDALREIHVDLPDLEERFAFACALWSGPVDGRTAHRRHLEQFALECEGETLVAMRSIATLARAEQQGPEALPDVLRIYRTGSRRNPWTAPVLRSRMAQAREILGSRVKGQDPAIEKTLDILTRSITGLSGAQTRRRHARPRGVLFFAGPTGVGKTELAKSVTELLFGDEAACHRFDMSEFMEENAVLRLLGAPPGHAGHDRGGELINALQARPFSVVLFDEIEKAHPRILDVFLQILDEGRLTDSRGSVAHFSEALIIFTSNIGMFGNDHTQNMGMNVMPSDPYDQIERKITQAVHDHFRYTVQRPELMNRIGQNVVVFDFINHRSVHIIFDAILGRVLETIREEHGLEVELTEGARADLKDLCTHDVFDGGRGIGNRIETHFINPVAREIFFHPGAERMQITSVREVDGRTRLELA